MTVHVYSGPSLAGTGVLDRPGVCAHPPIAHGDLFRLTLRPGDTVLIVDGVYQHSSPVRHKEILSLCDEGVSVFGAASIGALRAAELAGYGMTGLGTVFGWYAGGRLESDADVALMHGEADVGFRAFTHALVSVIGAVDRLVAAGRLGSRDGAGIVDLARSVHFSVRSGAALKAAAQERGVPREMGVVLEALEAPLGDVKQTDAAEAVRDLLARNGSASPPSLSIPDTSYRREWRLLHTPAGPDADSATLRQVLAYAQLFLPDFPSRHTEYVMRRLGGRPPLWLRGLTAAELARRGLLSAGEVSGLSAGEQATRVLVRTFRLRPGRLVFDDLPPALAERVPELAVPCARMLRLSARVAQTNPLFHPADLPPDVVDFTFGKLWGCDDLGMHVLDRGFRDLDDFRLHARPFFVAARAALALPDPGLEEATHA